MEVSIKSLPPGPSPTRTSRSWFEFVRGRIILKVGWSVTLQPARIWKTDIQQRSYENPICWLNCTITTMKLVWNMIFLLILRFGWIPETIKNTYKILANSEMQTFLAGMYLLATLSKKYIIMILKHQNKMVKGHTVLCNLSIRSRALKKSCFMYIYCIMHMLHNLQKICCLC